VKIKNWEYKTLALTPKSGSLLKGEGEFLMRVQKEKITSGAKRTSKEISATHGREDLFESLRTLRLSIAKENNVPPYLIFSDKSLHDMCQLLPRNKSEFLMVNGVGQSKCERFGDEFIREVSRFS
jgi:ATP-dependent DNA helicase RecQ